MNPLNVPLGAFFILRVHLNLLQSRVTLHLKIAMTSSPQIHPVGRPTKSLIEILNWKALVRKPLLEKNYGETLVTAIYDDDSMKVKNILNQIGHLNFSLGKKHGTEMSKHLTPLAYAALMGKSEVLELLISKGADANEQGWSVSRIDNHIFSDPLNISYSYHVLPPIWNTLFRRTNSNNHGDYTCSRLNSKSCFKQLLLETSPENLAMTDGTGSNLLHYLAIHLSKNSDEASSILPLMVLLHEKGVSALVTNRFGETPAFCASKNSPARELLLEFQEQETLQKALPKPQSQKCQSRL